jgi:hypothetical protein
MKKLTLKRDVNSDHKIPHNPNTPILPDTNHDPTRKHKGGNEPQKVDPTRIQEPITTDPTRVIPVEPEPITPSRTGEIVLWTHYNGKIL